MLVGDDYDYVDHDACDVFDDDDDDDDAAKDSEEGMLNKGML